MVIDKENMLGVLESFPRQVRGALSLAKGLTVSKDVSNIIILGMGGSAIGGDLLKSYMSDSKIPVFVNRNYNLPGFADDSSLVFAVSYSGNTEETLSACKEALGKKATVVALTTGGKLAGLCEKVIKIPSGFQPRAAIGYLFFPLLGILYNSGIANVRNQDLNEMLSLLTDVDSYKEHAQALAKKIEKKIPIIYSSELLGPVAYRFKTQINENAKYPAYSQVFPEMNHNEINAFSFMDRRSNIVLMIRDDHDHERIKKRMNICKDLIENRVDVEDISTKGKSFLARVFSTIYLGDFTSYYLAIRNRVDPTPVNVIENLKKALAD
jgi:glucose/mannose-6-phosphate isomerase